MKRLVALFAAILLLISPSIAGHAGAAVINDGDLSIARVSEQATDVSLTLVRWRSYWYQDEILWVVGEIQNTGPVPVANPLVTGHFADSGGRRVADAASFADALLISPGGVSTFRLTLVNTVPGGVRLDAIELNGSPTDRVFDTGLTASVQRGAYEEIEQDESITSRTAILTSRIASSSKR